MGASGMAWSARSEKSRFSAGGPVSYLSHYLLDFYITVSIFILHNLLLLDSISFLLDSKSTFIRRSRAKHFGYPPFFDHKSATKPLQSHKDTYFQYGRFRFFGIFLIFSRSLISISYTTTTNVPA